MVNIIVARGLAAFALMCAVSPRSSALVITQSSSFAINGRGDGGHDWSSANTWSYLGFNSTVGVLQSVTLSAVATAHVSAFEHNAFSWAPLIDSYSYLPGVHMNLNAATFDGLAAQPGGYAASATGSVVVLSSNQTNSFAADLTASGQVSTTNAGLLASFAGQGQHMAFTTLHFGGNNYYGGTSVTGNVTVTLSYDYAAPVIAAANTPDSGSALMLFGGVGGLLGLIHRRRSARLAA